MMTKVFAIYDHKAKFFGAPFVMQQVGLAVRAFNDLVNEPGTSVSKHPADFSLFEVGSYDDSTAAMTSLVPHVLLGHGSDFRPTPEGRVAGVKAMETAVPFSESASAEPVE